MGLIIGYKPKDLQAAKDTLYIWKMKKICLESFICRIDPYKEGLLDMVLKDLTTAKDEIKRLKNIIGSMKLNWVIPANHKEGKE